MDNQLGEWGSFFRVDKMINHGYHRFYYHALKHLCDASFNMLEIGIEGFQSVDMWKRFFPKAKIYGIDINREYKDGRMCIFKADQSNLQHLQAVLQAMDSAKCAFINDDGSHIPEHQILTFNEFFPKLLTDGGVYIIEDIETSYWKTKGLYGYDTRYGYQHPKSIVTVFKHILDWLNRKYMNAQDRQMLRQTLNMFSDATLNAIGSITFGQNCIIIHKKTQYDHSFDSLDYQFADRV